ncbi:MAG: OadG family protein [Clostridiales bacterium]|nr:OadG family protein [Clostridiales bacterium]
MNLSFGLSVAAVGLLVVFAGLIILILCLKLLEFFFMDRQKKLPAAKAEASTAALPAHPEAIAPEVIAAITAAVSAVWREDTGFVVRRVRRIHSAPAWNRAGRDDQIYSRL